MLRTLSWLTLLLCLFFIISLLGACSDPKSATIEPIRPVVLFTLIDPTQHQLREFPAQISAREEADLSFRIPGELVQLPVLGGSIVEQGELLAQLDDREYRNQLAARQADFELADADFRRLKELRARKVASQADYDNASARLKSAQVALKMAEDQLSYTRLLAPFSGRIAQRYMKNFQAVQAMQPVLLLQEHQWLDVSIQVSEGLITRLNKDRIDPNYQPKIRFTGHPQEFSVNYKERATQIGSGTQAYEVVFSLPNPAELTIYPGMSATLILDLSLLQPTQKDENKGEFIVPLTAVLKNDSNGQHQVWLYQADGRVIPKIVTLGRMTQEGVVIYSDDLSIGDRIAAAGLNRLRAGMQVKPLHRERGI